MKQITIIAATPLELACVGKALMIDQEVKEIVLDDKSIRLVSSGIGSVSAASCTTREILLHKPDLLVQIGIAGSYDRSLPLGSVVQIREEWEADLGIELSDGSFRSLEEEGLEEVRRLLNPSQFEFGLPTCEGLTVQMASGTQARIDNLTFRFPNAQIESMEGAGFFRACLASGVKFAQLRAISNYVEPRNRSTWQMGLALDNLGGTMRNILEQLG